MHSIVYAKLAGELLAALVQDIGVVILIANVLAQAPIVGDITWSDLLAANADAAFRFEFHGGR